MKKIFRILAMAAILAGGFYVYRMADLYLNQAAHVYHPTKEWLATPESFGMAYEELLVPSTDASKLSFWYIPAEASRGTILFLHGNARNMSSDLDAIQMYHGFGYNILAIDYRGYGKSEGQSSEQGTYEDAQISWNWLVGVKKESPDRIVIAGRSLGAAIAADLASKNAPKALILEAAFTSLAEVGQDLYPYFPVKLLSRYHYDTLARLRSVSCPVLIVHSRDDELIRFKHAERLYEAVKGEKDMVVIGGPHKGGFKPTLQKYNDGIQKFLSDL